MAQRAREALRADQVKVPAGAEHGDELEAGGRDFVVKQQPHGRFKRKGSSLLHHAVVSPLDFFGGESRAAPRGTNRRKNGV